MAHLKDLIVTGVSRFLGTVYAKLFKGDLEGTATKAMNDSAGNKITSTYIKDISGVGVNSLNITKGDGTSSNVTMSMEPRVVNLGDQETSTRSCVTSFGQGISIYTCANWTDKPAGAPDNQGTLITVAYNNSGNEMGTKWVWAHQYFISPFVTYPWVRMGSSEVLTEWTPINRADIPSSNPNLLINPDFKINQRGQTEYSNTSSTSTYCVDRWCHNGTCTLSDNGLIVSSSGSVWGYGVFQQIVENTELTKYMVTLQFKANGVVNSVTWIPVSNALSDNCVIMDGDTAVGYARMGFDGAMGRLIVEFIIYQNYQMTIEWVKLEVGPAATQFVPPDPATELLKCQRYYEIINVGTKALNPDDYWIGGARFNVEKYRVPDVVLRSVLGTLNVLSAYNGADSSITITNPCNRTKQEIHGSPCSAPLGHVTYIYIAYIDAEIYRN